MNLERTPAPTGDKIIVPVHEEVLDPAVQEREAGTVTVTTRVEETVDRHDVEAARDEVTVERVAVNRVVDTAPEPFQDGDTLVIPVVEEVIVTTTQLVVREEVRISRRRIVETVPVEATLRRQVVDVSEIGEREDGDRTA